MFILAHVSQCKLTFKKMWNYIFKHIHNHSVSVLFVCVSLDGDVHSPVWPAVRRPYCAAGQWQDLPGVGEGWSSGRRVGEGRGGSGQQLCVPGECCFSSASPDSTPSYLIWLTPHPSTWWTILMDSRWRELILGMAGDWVLLENLLLPCFYILMCHWKVHTSTVWYELKAEKFTFSFKKMKFYFTIFNQYIKICPFYNATEWLKCFRCCFPKLSTTHLQYSPVIPDCHHGSDQGLRVRRHRCGQHRALSSVSSVIWWDFASCRV